jgi:DNA adenine methylase
MDTNQTHPIRPFLKWAGGKFRLIPRIQAKLPPGRRLIEPFVGSAAVWLNTSYPSALLADANQDLIACYQHLKRYGPDFIQACQAYFTSENNTPQQYYALRDRFNASQDPWERATLFVYLNRHGYNGLCRYNAAGEFNVPFGRYQKPYFPATEMHSFWQRAKKTTFRCADFREILAKAKPGDVVYCDPPYVPLSKTANFTDYSAGGFTEQDQTDLTHWAEILSSQGIPVLISNHSTPFTNKAYRNAQIERFAVQRFISCNGNNRHHANELLALFGGNNR